MNRNTKRPPRIPNAARVRVESEQLSAACDGRVTGAKYDEGWLYRIDVTAGDQMDSERDERGELWVCGFEIASVPENG